MSTARETSYAGLGKSLAPEMVNWIIQSVSATIVAIPELMADPPFLSFTRSAAPLPKRDPVSREFIFEDYPRFRPNLSPE